MKIRYIVLAVIVVVGGLLLYINWVAGSSQVAETTNALNAFMKQ